MNIVNIEISNLSLEITVKSVNFQDNNRSINSKSRYITVIHVKSRITFKLEYDQLVFSNNNVKMFPSITNNKAFFDDVTQAAGSLPLNSTHTKSFNPVSMCGMRVKSMKNHYSLLSVT